MLLAMSNTLNFSWFMRITQSHDLEEMNNAILTWIPFLLSVSCMSALSWLNPFLALTVTGSLLFFWKFLFTPLFWKLTIPQKSECRHLGENKLYNVEMTPLLWMTLSLSRVYQLHMSLFLRKGERVCFFFVRACIPCMHHLPSLQELMLFEYWKSLHTVLWLP